MACPLQMSFKKSSLHGKIRMLCFQQRFKSISDMAFGSAVVLSPSVLPELVSRADSLQKSCTAMLVRQGFDQNRITAEIYLNLRYQGTDTALMTLKPEANWDFSTAFVERHRQEFGFSLPNCEILVDDVRVRCIGRSLESEGYQSRVHEEIRTISRRAVTKQQVERVERVYWDGNRIDTPVYRLQTLSRGDEIHGPALIMDVNATIAVEKNCRALVTSEHIFIQVGGENAAKVGTELDPIQLSIFAHRFMSIAGDKGDSNFLTFTLLATDTLCWNRANGANLAKNIDFYQHQRTT